MGILKSLAGSLPSMNEKALLPALYNNPGLTTLNRIGNEGVTIYPSDNGHTNINNGYKKSAIVYSIVSKCGRKFGQVPWYHYRIKKNERKTWQEYIQLTKDGLSPKAMVEAVKMRTKSVDQVIVDSVLTRKLANPNRNETRSAFMERLYIYKLLTGEGNIWFSRGFDDNGNQVTAGKPLELVCIPKGNLNLVKGSDAWDIAGYEIVINGQRFRTPKDNIDMWTFTNPVAEIDGVTLSHLRGMAPLEAGIMQLQGSNVGAEKLINMNANQGAAAIAANETADLDNMTPEQSIFFRNQFNSIVNNSDVNGKVVAFTGKWSIHQIGMNVKDLMILEQMEVQAKWLCNIYDFPWGLFEGNQTFANKLEDKRNLVYDRIAPDLYTLRDELNDSLIDAYGLDRESNVLDVDLLSLPELALDMKTQIQALKDADWLTYDEKREASGFDRLNTPATSKIYVDGNKQLLDDIAEPRDYED